MRKVLRCRFTNMDDWDGELDDAARRFKDRFGVYPNILLAGPATYDAIDARANNTPAQVVREGDGAVLADISKECGPAPLAGFSTEEYDIEFCIGRRMGYGKIKLIRDDSPEFIQGGYDDGE